MDVIVRRYIDTFVFITISKEGLFFRWAWCFFLKGFQSVSSLKKAKDFEASFVH